VWEAKAKDHYPPHNHKHHPNNQSTMSALAIGLGILGAGFGGRVAYQMFRAGARGGADKWVKGGFKAKMDKLEATQVLGLR
jgi:hypothetical protein